MSACAVLNPEPTVLETETSKEEKVIPLPQDSVSTLSYTTEERSSKILLFE